MAVRDLLLAFGLSFDFRARCDGASTISARCLW